MFGEYSHACESGLEAQERAHAKVNLLLMVGERLSDGFHPVVTVLQNLELCDDVRIRVAPAGAEAGRAFVDVASDDPALPKGLDNLAGRAAARLLEKAGAPPLRVSIEIKKRIPVAAGLAGGSSDAAAVLRGLNRLLRPGLAPDELLEVAAGLGSDVPACLVGGTLLGAGRGEKVVPLRSSRFWWVLANPGVELSTARVYACFDEDGEEKPDAAALRRPLDELAPGFADALRAGDVKGLAARVRNDLAPAARRLCPEVSRLLSAMEACGARAALVSGSGPTVAGLALDEADAREIANRLRPHAPWVWWGSSVHEAVWPGLQSPSGT